MNKMEDKKEKVYQLIIGDEDAGGVSTISFVQHPAHESNFMFFSKEESAYKFAKEGEKMMVYGAALIPNKKIYRKDENHNEYHVFFDEDTVAKCQELYFKRGQNIDSNINHDTQIEGVTVVESWIVEDPNLDKTKALGFENIPKKSWVVGYKVDNEEIWEKIKNGDSLNGFSIEGKFIHDLIEMNDQTDYDKIVSLFKSNKSDDDLYEEIKKILDK